MAKNTAAQDEFVDLYEVLELPEDSDSDTIRKRLNVLYIEAQQNLDHRNVKKRLEFQQMYEIYLPQARHLLLDPNRRAEYDRYLTAYRTGSKVEPSSVPPPVASLSDMQSTPTRADVGIPELVEEVDPEKLAAERESMWAKWKTGLETVSVETPPEPLPSTTTSAAPPPQTTQARTAAPTPVPAPRGARPVAPANPGGARARPAQVVPRLDPRKARPATPRVGAARPGTPGSISPQEHAAAALASDVEKKREEQRYQLIKDSVQTTGLIWGASAGAVGFIIGCGVLLVLDNLLKPNYLGMPRLVFAGLGFFLVLIAAAITGLIMRKKAKRRAVTELSTLSIEELMRRSR